jgi:hypothetical protein
LTDDAEYRSRSKKCQTEKTEVWIKPRFQLSFFSDLEL